MTRKEITNHVGQPILETVLNLITEALRNGEQVDLRRFGTFKVVERKAKKGRNVYTGEPVDVPAKKVVKFYPSDKLL